jgi:hypothetical protein
MEKNVTGQKWYVRAYDRTNLAPKLGDAANITANLRIDGAAANAVDDVNPTELEDGYYVFDITQAESNGDYILICPSSTTVNINVEGVPKSFTTTPPNFNKLGIESDGDLSKVNSIARPSGAVVADPANGASGFKTDLTEVADDYWLNAWVKFTSGALINQIRKIEHYNGTSKVLMLTFPFTSTPAGGDPFELVVE